MSRRRFRGLPDGLHLLDSEIAEVERRLDEGIDVSSANRKWFLAAVLLLLLGSGSFLASIVSVVFFSKPFSMNLMSVAVLVPIGALIAFLISIRERQRAIYEILYECGHNVCPKCGYLRTGLEDTAPCPECGRALDQSTEPMI